MNGGPPIPAAIRIARNGNVRAIRRGIAIPDQREEDLKNATLARLAASYREKAYQLAQTEPDSHEHRLALHMAGIDHELPRNNLRVHITPVTPRQEWFYDAFRRWVVARDAAALANSRDLLACHLDRQDGGERNKATRIERDRAEADLRHATEEALRTPTTRKCDAARKQDLIGKREWASVHRPEWQAMVDEDLTRYPAPKRRQKTEAKA